jgi:hypothetical protein
VLLATTPAKNARSDGDVKRISDTKVAGHDKRAWIREEISAGCFSGTRSSRDNDAVAIFACFTDGKKGHAASLANTKKHDDDDDDDDGRDRFRLRGVLSRVHVVRDSPNECNHDYPHLNR